MSGSRRRGPSAGPGAGSRREELRASFSFPAPPWPPSLQIHVPFLPLSSCGRVLTQAVLPAAEPVHPTGSATKPVPHRVQSSLRERGAAGTLPGPLPRATSPPRPPVGTDTTSLLDATPVRVGLDTLSFLLQGRVDYTSESINLINSYGAEEAASNS